jgi:DNA-binding NarL/FixJ family response regulator
LARSIANAPRRSIEDMTDPYDNHSLTRPVTTIVATVFTASFTRRARNEFAYAVLTARERDVLSLMAEGRSNSAIAARRVLAVLAYLKP